MFLCQVDGTFVGDTEVNRKLADKEHGQIVILGNQGGDSTHRNQTDNGRFKSSCSGNEVLFRKVGAVRKIFPRFDHANNLTSSSYTIFEDFYFPTDKTHQMRRCFPFAVDGFIFFVGLYRIIVHQKLLLLVV